MRRGPLAAQVIEVSPGDTYPARRDDPPAEYVLDDSAVAGAIRGEHGVDEVVVWREAVTT